MLNRSPRSVRFALAGRTLRATRTFLNSGWEQVKESVRNAFTRPALRAAQPVSADMTINAAVL